MWEQAYGAGTLFRKYMAEHAGHPAGGSPESSLLRALGTWGLAAGIVNVTIGGGIFRLPGSPEITGRLGNAAPLAYLVCAVAMGLIVLCIAEAGSRVSLTGGPYAYVEVAFGRYVGFLVGVLLWLLGTTAVPAVAGIFADNLARLIPVLENPLARFTMLALLLAFMAGTNIRGVRQGGWLNNASTVLKLVPLLLLAIMGAAAVGSSGIRWTEAGTSTTTIGDLSRASIVLIFAFAGVEAALVPSGEVRNTARTVPRAVFIAMTGITVLYIVLQVVAQGALGEALVGSATPLTDTAGVVLGPWGATLLSFGVLLSIFGYLSGMTLAIPRALFAFARDGFLPRQVAAVHPRFHTPHVAIAAQTLLVLLLATTSGFERLAVIANGAALLVYLGCALAAWQLRRRGVRGEGEPFVLPGGPLVPVLASVVILALLVSVRADEWMVLLAVLAAASVVYVLARWRR